MSAKRENLIMMRSKTSQVEQCYVLVHGIVYDAIRSNSVISQIATRLLDRDIKDDDVLGEAIEFSDKINYSVVFLSDCCCQVHIILRGISTEEVKLVLDSFDTSDVMCVIPHEPIDTENNAIARFPTPGLFDAKVRFQKG
jgi:hypothetical protein